MKSRSEIAEQVKAKSAKFIVWSQHWVGYKPRKFGTYSTLAEAQEAADKLNASPSAQFYNYSVEVIDADS